MPDALPTRPSLDWLRKTAKQKLRAMRADDPGAKLADAQHELARDYGFSHWPALKREVDARSTREAVAVAHNDGTATREAVIGAFLRAVGSGDMAAVRAALAAEPSLVNAVGPHPFWGGRPQALHVAIDTNRRDMVDLLLAAGADTNGTNNEYADWSPLMLAFAGRRREIVDELLRHGARIGVGEALLSGDDGALDRLLRDTRSLEDAMPSDGSLLGLARTPHAIDRLLELGASATRKDRWGSTPIDAMSRQGTHGAALVRHMIARGIVARPVDYARLGDRATLAALLGADPHLVLDDSVIFGAVDFGHHKLVEWLLARGASVNARAEQPTHHTPLHSAAWEGDMRMATILIDAGADLAAIEDEHHGTPVDWAEAAATITNNPQCADVAEYIRARGGRSAGG